MKLGSLFIFEPCTGWSLKDRHEYDRNYSCTDDFAEDLCIKENMQLCNKEVEYIGYAMIIHLELRSNSSIRHPESNQAHYKAEAVLVTN